MKRLYRASNKPSLPFEDWVLSVPLRLNRPASDCREKPRQSLIHDTFLSLATRLAIISRPNEQSGFKADFRR